MGGDVVVRLSVGRWQADRTSEVDDGAGGTLIARSCEWRKKVYMDNDLTTLVFAVGGYILIFRVSCYSFDRKD